MPSSPPPSSGASEARASRNPPARPHRPADPVYGRHFDPWNAVSLGHQRAEASGGRQRGWRDARAARLADQLAPGATGPLCAAAPGPARSVLDMLRRRPAAAVPPPPPPPPVRGEPEPTAARRTPAIFAGLVVYVNGSMHPVVSDHRLKRVLAEHGARLAVHLARRQVTHVILGRPAPAGGSGGGLAAGKLEREARRRAGCGVKFVSPEWVLESVKAGCRLPEARFAGLATTQQVVQPSVYSTFSSGAAATTSSAKPRDTG